MRLVSKVCLASVLGAVLDLKDEVTGPNSSALKWKFSATGSVAQVRLHPCSNGCSTRQCRPHKTVASEESLRMISTIPFDRISNMATEQGKKRQSYSGNSHQSRVLSYEASTLQFDGRIYVGHGYVSDMTGRVRHMLFWTRCICVRPVPFLITPQLACCAELCG
ncbi:unnamed protein product [Musa acuminata subsp. burmannicoides]